MKYSNLVLVWIMQTFGFSIQAATPEIPQPTIKSYAVGLSYSSFVDNFTLMLGTWNTNTAGSPKGSIFLEKKGYMRVEAAILAGSYRGYDMTFFAPPP